MRNHQMPALRTIALVVIAVWGTSGHAAGLGTLRLQSALGQPLRASVPLLGDEVTEFTPGCVKVTLEQPDGTFMTGAQVAFSRTRQAPLLHLTTHQPVHEPALTVNVEVLCGMPIQRTYPVLLDPVVMLPQQATSERLPGNPRSSRDLPDDQLVSPGAASRTGASQRRTGSAQSQNNGGMAAASPAEPVTRTRRAAVPADPDKKKVVRNVLRLSGDDEPLDTLGSTLSSGLKLSATLSESRATADPQKTAELQGAHARFSAVMRGEDPVQSSELQIKGMHSKLQDLEKQMALIRQQGEQQRKADQAAIAGMLRERYSADWVVGLSALLAAALAAIGWLCWRMQQVLRKSRSAFWERTIIDEQAGDPDWDETLSPNGTLAEPATKGAPPDDPLPYDWERGAPLDNTLPVDWAAQQATLQNDTQQTPPVHGRHHASQPQQAGDDRQMPGESPADPFAAPAGAADLSRIVSSRPDLRQGPFASDISEATSAFNPVPAAGSAHAEPAPAKRAAGMHLLQVEEVSGLLQEAEFWMLLNDPERAIDILEPYASDMEPVSPVPWIYLLDLYSVTGQQAKYEALGMRIKQVFNTSVPAWGESSDSQSSRSLQDYPHVIQAIQDLWEGDYIVPYLESLLIDERDGARAGFDLAVYREIIHLIGISQDPDMPKQRAKLNFDKPNAHMISQQVRYVQKPAGPAAETGDALAALDNAATPQSDATQAFNEADERQGVANAASSAPVPVTEDRPAAAGSMAAAEQDAASMTGDTAASAGIQSNPGVADGAAGHGPSDDPVLEAKPVLADATAAGGDRTPAQEAQSLEEAIKAKRAAFAAQHKSSVQQQDENEKANADDMARKLDLSVAYREIGEHVGARVLLEEVIQGGTPIQASKAKEMLKKLLQEIDWH